ncbi:MAG: hypothetical protein HYZ31_01455 [Gammaproteobacteria bacterium]|nr:hypothetical protein [Gammaproteobacteria bacterium]
MNANKIRIFIFIGVHLRDAQGCANAAGIATAMNGGGLEQRSEQTKTKNI